jgi:hypothetical protein
MSGSSPEQDQYPNAIAEPKRSGLRAIVEATPPSLYQVGDCRGHVSGIPPLGARAVSCAAQRMAGAVEVLGHPTAFPFGALTRTETLAARRGASRRVQA